MFFFGGGGGYVPPPPVKTVNMGGGARAPQAPYDTLTRPDGGPPMTPSSCA